MKKQIIMLAVVTILGYTDISDAFCWYNNSSQAPQVEVWGFYSIDQANALKKTRGISSKVTEGIGNVAEQGGEAVEEVPEAEVATAAVSVAMPIMNVIVDAAATALDVKFRAMLTANQPNPKKACWNWQAIEKGKNAHQMHVDKNGNKTMYFMIWLRGDQGTSKVIWEGACNIKNGLTLRDAPNGGFIVDGQV